MIELIAFDADDTLWHNEVLYHQAQEKLAQLLAPHGTAEEVGRLLYQTEMRNLGVYGYGIKSFALSMIETAVALTGGKVTGSQVKEIIGFARAMLTADVRLLDGARETVGRLAETHRLMLITKGDLLDQQSKLARSGLPGWFHSVEVVTDKTEVTYRALLDRYRIAPPSFLMVGNSLRSDVLPVLALGGKAVYIPYHLTWEHEQVDTPRSQDGSFFELENLCQLPALVLRLDRFDQDREL